MKVFNHNFTDESFNIDAINAYLKCMTSLLKWIEAETEFNSAKRYIDSVKILDGIGQATKEINELHRKELDRLTDVIFSNAHQDALSKFSKTIN